MDPTTVFIKTPKGIQEVDNRTSGLSTELRSVLIWIDGKRTVQQLTKQLGKIGDIQAILKMLLVQDFIQNTSLGGHPPSATQKNTTIGSTELFADIYITKALLEVEVRKCFGLMAGPLLKKLERCQTLDEIRAYVVDCRSLVLNAFSSKKANEFWESVKKILPSVTKML